MATIVLGVSSSISIYKACEIVRGLQREGHQVRVIMTQNATRFISPRLFSALSGNAVIVNPWKERNTERIEHISLAREANLFIVAPATANVMAKMASGIADDFLSTFYLAVRCPVLIAPAMNEAMYLHPRTQANLEILRQSGVYICEPERGSLACGEEGWGRLAPVEKVLDMASRLLITVRQWIGKKVLITAGPTREPIDPVRFLSNRSSGKMGYELAAEARRRGAEVILISGPTALYPPFGVKTIRVETAEEMKREVEAHFEEAEVIVMAAAVADFRPASVFPEKWKKQAGVPKIELVPTSDILTSLSRHPERLPKILVGFAAETGNLEEAARRKIEEKKLDLIVANDISLPQIGFESDFNEVLILDRRGGKVYSGRKTKQEISRLIWDAIEAYRESQG